MGSRERQPDIPGYAGRTLREAERELREMQAREDQLAEEQYMAYSQRQAEERRAELDEKMRKIGAAAQAAQEEEARARESLAAERAALRAVGLIHGWEGGMAELVAQAAVQAEQSASVRTLAVQVRTGAAVLYWID